MLGVFKSMAGKKGKDVKGLSVGKDEDFSEWYTEVVQKAELADYSPVKGFMIIRPGAYSIWERIRENFDGFLKEKGIRNAYFPLLIPDYFFKKEAEHAEGFAPELAYIANNEEGEKLAIRPTSETIIYDSFSKWVRSWRDLPLKLNQWCNVLRWEVKQTKPFIRTREFLWQEGHCAFSNEKDAGKNQEEIILEYRKMVEGLLGIPVLLGRKSKLERFPGAKDTQTIEALMPDGKSLQCGTSHVLGQGFSKVFDLKFKDKGEKDQLAWTTSWGFSTRLIGAVIMVHGDDKGLVLPPRVAYHKGVVVPILFDESKEKVLKKSREISKKLGKFGVFVDDREEHSPGWKFNEWEIKGIPIRIEIGPKDIAAKKVTIVRRDTGKKEQVSEGKVVSRVGEMLEEMQKEMFLKAKKFLKSRIETAGSMAELKKKLKEGKIVKVFMKDDPSVEEKINYKVGAVSRIIEDVKKEGKCIESGEMVKTVGYIARAY
jgi:prolyl-tRNA synthetase